MRPGLCRTARLKALPSDEDVEALGVVDAGAFVLMMREKPDKHKQWLTRQMESAEFEQWGDEATDSPQ